MVRELFDWIGVWHSLFVLLVSFVVGIGGHCIGALGSFFCFFPFFFFHFFFRVFGWLCCLAFVVLCFADRFVFVRHPKPFFGCWIALHFCLSVCIQPLCRTPERDDRDQQVSQRPERMLSPAVHGFNLFAAETKLAHKVAQESTGGSEFAGGCYCHGVTCCM